MPIKDRPQANAENEERKAAVQHDFQVELEILQQIASDSRFWDYLKRRKIDPKQKDNAYFLAKLCGSCVGLQNAEISRTRPPTVNTEKTQFSIASRTDQDWAAYLGALLYNASTTRMVWLLNALGYYKQNPQDEVQLSLGVGTALGEIYGLHLSPGFKIEKDKVSIFSERGLTKLIYLVDKEPEKKENRRIRMREHPNSYRFTGDAESSLNPALIRTPANLVTMLRMVPNLIASEYSFFPHLARVIQPTADFIMTLGTTDNDAGWATRTAKMSQISAYLQDRGMSPHQIDLTKDGDRRTSIWGRKSYEHTRVLHCKLDRNLLLK